MPDRNRSISTRIRHSHGETIGKIIQFVWTTTIWSPRWRIRHTLPSQYFSKNLSLEKFTKSTYYLLVDLFQYLLTTVKSINNIFLIHVKIMREQLRADYLIVESGSGQSQLGSANPVERPLWRNNKVLCSTVYLERIIHNTTHALSGENSAPIGLANILGKNCYLCITKFPLRSEDLRIDLLQYLLNKIIIK